VNKTQINDTFNVLKQKTATWGIVETMATKPTNKTGIASKRGAVGAIQIQGKQRHTKFRSSCSMWKISLGEKYSVLGG